MWRRNGNLHRTVDVKMGDFSLSVEIISSFPLMSNLKVLLPACNTLYIEFLQ